ncbi:hypothetical protein ATE68_16370 [Sphingopyxis sp. H038]|uniref:Uncharacterized protein (TIGR02444 family) n=1 Tax=Sphingopyxis italica TaxID=1129133 RepID=A0A7X6B860_9SPHN|nr:MULTISPECIES: TIGR02444 family protein [Sphingomonadaceae]MBA4751283.1 TIGR02444 family protein [Sphingopyxis sp.]MBN8843070.1 TIGR02444 family protein [Sphingomonadales bacterium]MBU0824206.1 TIGR02444 family protein [Alphaproteobacteria bacterium]NJB88457.1 uncharacterized protein (TIGR02444 family) [Sphingopyxis italica]KGB52072.1 hypothetical protein FG95_03682 [Sphingopyxis sp. LC363]
MKPLDPDTFWRFSVSAYAQPGVADICLSLQDDHGFDVNLLLLCCWLAQLRSIVLSETELRFLLAEIEATNSEVIGPLRQARRWLKAPASTSGASAAKAQRVRRLVKMAELEGERLAQHLLISAASALGAESCADRMNAANLSLTAYTRIVNETDAADALQSLARLVVKERSKDPLPS